MTVSDATCLDFQKHQATKMRLQRGLGEVYCIQGNEPELSFTIACHSMSDSLTRFSLQALHLV